MKKPLAALLLGLWMAAAPAAGAPDSQLLERELQQLSWGQFRAVVEAIPQLKADVEAYGPAGWEFVKAKYKIHRWKKSIERLGEAEKRQLSALVRDAKTK